MENRKKKAYREPLEEDSECELKLEAPPALYRIADQLAYHSLSSDDRELFCDYLQDALAHHLALQGCTVAAILGRTHERGMEHAQRREWVVEPPHEDKGLLWVTARYGLAALGVEPTGAAVREDIDLFLNALAFAQVRRAPPGRSPKGEGLTRAELLEEVVAASNPLVLQARRRSTSRRRHGTGPVSAVDQNVTAIT